MNKVMLNSAYVDEENKMSDCDRRRNPTFNTGARDDHSEKVTFEQRSE